MSYVRDLHELLKDETPANRFKIVQHTEQWCSKCLSFYQKTVEVAERKQIKVIDKPFDTHITLCCELNHTFEISYAKSLLYLSCLECQRLDKIAQRQREIDQENERKERCRKMQEKLFAQARNNMEDDRNCICEACKLKALQATS